MPQQAKNLTILMFEGDSPAMSTFCEALDDIAELLVTIERVSGYEEAVAALTSQPVDLLVIDCSQGTEESAILDRIRSDRRLPPVVALSDEGDESFISNLFKVGADDFVPITGMSRQLVQHAISNGMAQEQRRSLRERNDKLVRENSESQGSLEQQNIQLREICQLAQEFVDNVSQEFRTPLAVIKEFTAILRDRISGPLNNEQAEYVDIIGARVDDLTLMVNDMLDISKLEAGLLNITRLQCDFHSIARQVFTPIERKAAVNQVNIEMDIESGIPAVYCDPDKIGRVMINLLVNAIKFSDADDRVTFRARYNPAGSEIVVSISDQGPGIEEQQLAEIIERFGQVECGERASTKGFGLGLNIARDLVQLNFGEIAVESQLGQGTTFTFTIPEASPETYIERYLEKMGMFRSASSSVSLVRIISDGANDESCKELGHFVQHHIRRSDLLFNCDSNSWLLVVAANATELQNVVARIQNAQVAANQNRTENPMASLNFDVLGSWCAEGERPIIVDAFRGQMNEPAPAV